MKTSQIKIKSVLLKLIFIFYSFLSHGQTFFASYQAANYKPNFITAGMRVRYEVTNTSSYSGTGTTITDLIGNANGTLYNSPTYINNAGTYLNMSSASSNYILTGNIGSVGVESVFMWVYPTGNGVLLSEVGQAAINTGWHDAQMEITGTTIRYSVWPYTINANTGFISSNITLNTWHYVGFTYDGATLNAYLDGASVGTYSIAKQNPTNLYFGIGATDATNTLSTGGGGYGNFRFGAFHFYTRVLTSNEVLLNYNSTKIATYITSSNATLTGASVVAQSPFSSGGNSYYTVGSTSSYVSFPGKTSLALGTGDYTIEWFQYQTASTTWPRIFWYGTSPSLGVSLEGSYYVWPSVTPMASHGTILNTWVHFALVRISGKLYLYKNGTLISSASGIANTTNITDASSTFFLGTKAAGGVAGEQFAGYITNFRIVKGLGVYTGNFTTPTSVLNGITSANPYGGSNTAAIPAGYTSVLLIP